jgi:hypothetical protein
MIWNTAGPPLLKTDAQINGLSVSFISNTTMVGCSMTNSLQNVIVPGYEQRSLTCGIIATQVILSWLSLVEMGGNKPSGESAVPITY